MNNPDAASSGDRKFGYWAGHFIVVASMIGAGILTTSGFTLQATGNPQALLGLWLLGGILALCGAVTVAELATTLPRSGGDYVFVREAYGRGAGIVSGWATFTLGFSAPTAVVATAAMNYLSRPLQPQIDAAFPTWIAEHIVKIGATILILSVAIIHTLGARQSSIFQVTATIIKAAILLALAVGGILFGTGDWSHLQTGGWPPAEQWGPLAIGLIYIGYAYSGWNGAAYMAGEIRNPSKLLPLCLIGGTLTVVILYLLVNLAYIYALDPQIMASKKIPEDIGEIQNIAETASAALFGRSAANVVAVALGLSLIASVSAYVLTGPRVAFAMARDNAFPAYAGWLHPVRETPILATMTQAVLAISLVWSGNFLELLNFTAAGLAALSGLTVAAVFPLRRRTDLAHPFRMPLYPLPPLLYLGFMFWTVGSSVYREIMGDGKLPGPILLSLITLLIGIPLAQLIPASRTPLPPR